MIPLSIEIADINEAMKRTRVNEFKNLFSGFVIAITWLRSNVKFRNPEMLKDYIYCPN